MDNSPVTDLIASINAARADMYNRYGVHARSIQVGVGLFQKQVQVYAQDVAEQFKELKSGLDLMGVVVDEFCTEYKKPNKKYYLQYTDRVNGKDHDRARASIPHPRTDPGFARKYSRHRPHSRRGRSYRRR